MAALRRPGESVGRVALTLVTALLVLAVWVALVLRTFGWPVQWLIIGAALVHYVLWLAPLGLVLALLNRRWATSVVALIATALAMLVQVPPTVAEHAPGGGRHLTVLQANLKIGAADPDALVRLVRARRVDVLATEELTSPEAERLVRAGLPGLLPYRYLRPLRTGGSGSGIWSRWPLTAQQDVPGFYLSTVLARVSAPGGPLTMVAVHLTPPWPFPQARWLAEIPRLRALLRKQPTGVPVVAAGDFNATVDHAQFRSLLGHGYSDVAEDAGAGYLPSYPNDRWYGPVIGIDHVLVRQATGTSARTLDLPGSDHRALLVRVALSGR